MEILLAVLLTVGVSYLLFGVFNWVKKGCGMQCRGGWHGFCSMR